MPTYDYRCANGHRFELFHGIKDDSPKPCPECGSESKRVPAGGSGLLFRGSGFHVTDYRSPHYKERAKADKPAGGSSPGDSGGGAKPAGGSFPGDSGGGAKPPKPDRGPGAS